MIREIKAFDLKTLRKISRPVTEINNNLINDLFETLDSHDGLGLSAIQIGIAEQIFVIKFDGKREVFINPKLSAYTKERSKKTEGCLSLPGIERPVKRPIGIVVSYIDSSGQINQLMADNLLARVIQHELDHLKGKLIIDY